MKQPPTGLRQHLRARPLMKPKSRLLGGGRLSYQSYQRRRVSAEAISQKLPIQIFATRLPAPSHMGVYGLAAA